MINNLQISAKTCQDMPRTTPRRKGFGPLVCLDRDDGAILMAITQGTGEKKVYRPWLPTIFTLFKHGRRSQLKITHATGDGSLVVQFQRLRCTMPFMADHPTFDVTCD